MFESLTRYIDQIDKEEAGEWIYDHINDGSPEHPISMPYVQYRKVISEFIKSIYDFMDSHQDMKLNNYQEILKRNGFEWGTDSMSNVDVSSFDGVAVMALLFGAVRAERFCDGALLGLIENGSILKWLKRLKELDDK